MRLRAVVVALALAASASAASADPAPILGGTRTTVGQFPSVVALYIQNPGALCTGTLISPNWVLTAAHCVDPATLKVSQATITSSMLVLFDETVAGSGGKMIHAKNTMAHPQYDNGGGLNWDVGLVELATPVTDRKPIPINRSAADAPSSGLKLELVGYGVSTSGGNNAGTEYFLENKTNYSCTNVGDPGALDANLICWDQVNGTSGIDEGDSGGPAFATIAGVKKQVGITSVSWSSTNANPPLSDIAGADTRVDHIASWLDSVIGDEIKCAADGVCGAGCSNDPDCPNCTKDSDCTGTDQVCDKGQCVPAPNTPGGTGSTCTTGTDCASGICGTVGTDKKCTESCTVGDSTTCPSGFDCLDAGGGTGACWPGANNGSTDSSCSAGGGASGAALFLISIGALFVRRRPRR